MAIFCDGGPLQWWAITVTPVVYELEQSKIGQKMCFSNGDICINFAAQIKFFLNIFLYFSQ